MAIPFEPVKIDTLGSVQHWALPIYVSLWTGSDRSLVLHHPCGQHKHTSLASRRRASSGLSCCCASMLLSAHIMLPSSERLNWYFELTPLPAVKTGFHVIYQMHPQICLESGALQLSKICTCLHLPVSKSGLDLVKRSLQPHQMRNCFPTRFFEMIASGESKTFAMEIDS